MFKPRTMVALTLLAGCSPLTRYRQSLLVPPASPTVVVGAPLQDGQVAVGANVSGY